jgi:hypothetical protein
MKRTIPELYPYYSQTLNFSPRKRFLNQELVTMVTPPISPAVASINHTYMKINR